jgi:cyclic pyranopterin phosphate synthase
MNASPSNPPPRDAFARPLRDLRISVTDRCNFRCVYCMPLEEYPWLGREDILSFEEIARLAAIFVRLGVEKVRITGGEPLVRRDLERLVARLAAIPGLADLSLTTNGALLARQAPALAAAGLRRINVSLDTLDRARFRRLTQRGDLDEVLAGVFAARDAGLAPLKLNAVVIRGFNDDEVLPLVEFARAHGFEMRFIEYMDVGNASGWSLEKTVPKREILDAIAARYPLVEAGRADGRAPAVDYRFADGRGEVGIIGSVTEPFCASCTRARLTADGRLVTCLFASEGRDLKGLLRAGASDGEVAAAIRSAWSARRDRFSDERSESLRSGGYRPEARRKIEMITLGG